MGQIQIIKTPLVCDLKSNDRCFYFSSGKQVCRDCFEEKLTDEPQSEPDCISEREEPEAEATYDLPAPAATPYSLPKPFAICEAKNSPLGYVLGVAADENRPRSKPQPLLWKANIAMETDHSYAVVPTAGCTIKTTSPGLAQPAIPWPDINIQNLPETQTPIPWPAINIKNLPETDLVEFAKTAAHLGGLGMRVAEYTALFGPVTQSMPFGSDVWHGLLHSINHYWEMLGVG